MESLTRQQDPYTYIFLTGDGRMDLGHDGLNPINLTQTNGLTSPTGGAGLGLPLPPMVDKI